MSVTTEEILEKLRFKLKQSLVDDREKHKYWQGYHDCADEMILWIENKIFAENSENQVNVTKPTHSIKPASGKAS